MEIDERVRDDAVVGGQIVEVIVSRDQFLIVGELLRRWHSSNGVLLATGNVGGLRHRVNDLVNDCVIEVRRIALLVHQQGSEERIVAMMSTYPWVP